MAKKAKTLQINPDSKSVSRKSNGSKASKSKSNNGISKIANKRAVSFTGNSAAAAAQIKNDGSDPNRPIRVYADGVFDMYHIGHARVLEQAKKLFPNVHLIVGVSGDEETVRKKGKIVMSQKERCDILNHCKWVDEIICPCPWVIDLKFLNEQNIDYVAHDDLPYGSVGQCDIYAEIKKAGKFMATQRTEGISTSDIILRIIQDYDLYVNRSMQRGYNRKEIGLSWTKYQRMKWMSQMKANTAKYVKKFDEYKHKFESDPYVNRFKGSVKRLLGIEAPELKALEGSDEESDFDA